jgi:ABC-2 type transport system permease protein
VTDQGAVFDLGYAPHEGERLGRRGATMALYRDGLRRVLGLRRRARKKVLPFFLIALALMPALFFLAFSVLLGDFAEDTTFFDHAVYFDLTGSVALVFVALAAAELIVPDRVHGTMAVYASRPLAPTDYLLWRGASLATVAFGFLWLPHVVLYLGNAWVSGDGFGTFLWDNIDTAWQTALASGAYLVGFAPLAFLVAAFSKRASVAAAVFIGGVTISGPTTRSLIESGFDVFGLGALQHHPGVVKDWVMNEDTHSWIPLDAGFEPIVSLLVMAAIAVLSAVVVQRRYRKAV